jgi:hypothetical protein
MYNLNCGLLNHDKVVWQSNILEECTVSYSLKIRDSMVSKSLVTTYQPTWCHTSENYKLNNQLLLLALQQLFKILSFRV